MGKADDRLERRCPMLGGPVPFGYCRTCGQEGLPCWKILDCWWQTFDIAAHLQATLTEAQYRRLLAARPKPKLTTLVELIAQARKRRPPRRPTPREGLLEEE
jgi:hypothetical protein